MRSFSLLNDILLYIFLYHLQLTQAHLYHRPTFLSVATIPGIHLSLAEKAFTIVLLDLYKLIRDGLKESDLLVLLTSYQISIN